MASLTSHLLALDQETLKKATTHPFLSAAATNSLPLDKLKHWLAQDRLYALSYVNFIGSLLSQISVPSSAKRESTIEWRVADCLIDCLTNIRREIQLFEEAASAEGWLEDICEPECERPTRCYRDLFAGAVAQGRPLVVGLVILWATEKCYLEAWRHAQANMVDGLREEEMDVMQRVFIPNWSSLEFETFVDRIGGLVDTMGLEAGVKEGSWVWKECEAAWRQVVWVEAEFWPHVDERQPEEMAIHQKPEVEAEVLLDVDKGDILTKDQQPSQENGRLSPREKALRRLDPNGVDGTNQDIKGGVQEPDLESHKGSLDSHSDSPPQDGPEREGGGVEEQSVGGSQVEQVEVEER